MPKISQRSHLLQSSPVRRLSGLAAKAVSNGIKVYHLNIGQPDISFPAQLNSLFTESEDKGIPYTQSEGTPSYRQKLSIYYTALDYQFNPDEVIVTAGGSEAILFGMIACLNPGDEILIPEPYYANFNGIAAIAGVKIVGIKNSQPGFQLPTLQDFESAISPRTKAILICSPNNPTGYVYTRIEIELVGQLALKHDLYIFSDEAYRDFIYSDKTYFSPGHLPDLENHTLIFDSVSKRYNMCGLRIGCVLTKNSEVLQSIIKQAQTRLSPSYLGQRIAERALETPSSFFADCLAEFSARRDLISNFLVRQGIVCEKPEGAFYVMPNLPIDDSNKFCEWLITSFNYNGSTVMLSSATGFYQNPEDGKYQVRIAYVLNRQDLMAALSCLGAALEIYPGLQANSRKAG